MNRKLTPLEVGSFFGLDMHVHASKNLDIYFFAILGLRLLVSKSSFFGLGRLPPLVDEVVIRVSVQLNPALPASTSTQAEVIICD